MYCTKCGNKLLENAKFCTKCGTKIVDVESNNLQTTKAVSQNGKVPKKKSKKCWIFCLLLFIIILGVGILLWAYWGKVLIGEKNGEHIDINTILTFANNGEVNKDEIDKSEMKAEENIITDYDVILYEDSDYTIVAKKESGFDNVSIKIGVLNGDKTQWIHSMTSRHIFLEKDGWGRTSVYVNETESSPTYGQILHNEIRYVGEGMFVSRAGMSSSNKHTYLTFYNVIDNMGFMIDAAPITYSYFGSTALGRNYRLRFEDGKAIVVSANDGIVVVDTQGNSKSTKVGVAFDKSLGKYSCGLFFCGDGFYNTSGGRVINLSSYKKQIFEYYGCYDGPYFESEDGTAKIYMIGADGEVYYMEVDYEGKFLTSEPVKKQ